MSHRDTVDDEHWFSSSNGRSDLENYPDFRGYATGMRPRSQGWLGRVFTLGEIRPQQ